MLRLHLLERNRICRLQDRFPWSVAAGKLIHFKGTSMPRMWNASLVLLLMFLAPHSALAQDAAEAAAATSSSGIAASGAKAAPLPGINPQPSSSPHLVAREGPAPDELNRKEFEESAGRDAGKLLMRSTPTGAQVFVNGRMVGKAPLLLILAPGKYK